MKSYITGFNEEKLQEIKTHPYFEKKREELRSRAEKYFETEPPRFKFSDMHLFVTTGNRTNYERVYNEYTGRLAAFSNAYLILGEEKYIEEIGNTVWAICDLETWGLPAHVLESYPIDHRRCFLELCSVNVGRYFGEILSFMEDKLPELVVKRMKHEVRERIIEGFKKYEFGWKYGTNNWTAVCVAGILASYIYFAEENEVNEMIPTFLEIADRYLMGFDKDGCCMEGYAYWAYGFSYYCYFADLLKNYTNGKIDLFSDPRVHAIAKFQENCAINDTQCIRFSDCGEYFKPAPFLSHFLKNVYPDVQIPSLELDASSAITLRDFLWPDPALAVSTMKPESKIYREAQWFIYRSDAYNFACKAGCNAESHNHNDVGSFMISKGGRVTFTDRNGQLYAAVFRRGKIYHPRALRKKPQPSHYKRRAPARKSQGEVEDLYRARERVRILNGKRIRNSDPRLTYEAFYLHGVGN